jgi:hypothetical protein
MGRFVREHMGRRGDELLGERHAFGLGPDHKRESAATAFTEGHHDPATVGLVPP